MYIRIYFQTFVLLLAASSCAWAQATATATLSGVVVDESEAVVPNARVTITDPSTAIRREVLAGESGRFTAVALQPGAYAVRAEAAGFRPTEVSRVVLEVGQDVAVTIRLTVATQEATITVVAEAPLVRENATVATVVNQQFIQNQPLNGRSFQSLIALAPGVVFTSTSVGSQGQFSVNGQRASTNYFTVDGVSANFGVASAQTLYEPAGGGLPSLTVQGTTSALASVDAVREFAIQTSTFAPEFGRTPGAQVSVVTRSGSNELHGALFDYLRNDKFDANDWFANSNRLPKPPLRQNDFGGVLGGPVYIPHFYRGRNRTFFFISYEGLRLRQPVVSSPQEVPTQAARQNAPDSIKPLLNAFPLPNGPVLSTDPNTATFTGSFSNPSRLDATSFRIDHRITDSMTMFGRYSHAPSQSRARANFNTPNTINPTDALTETVTGGVTLTSAPTTVIDLRLNYSRSKADSRRVVDSFGGAVVPPSSLFFPSFSSAETGQATYVVGSSRLQSGFAADNRQSQFNLVSSLSRTIGLHSVKIGLDYRRLLAVNNLPQYVRQLEFDSVARLLTQVTTLARFYRYDIDLYPLFHNFSAFAQDTWRPTQKLTLTYGLRYDINPAASDQNGNNPLTAENVNTPANVQLAPRDKGFYRTTYNNFAPRVGVAYRLRQLGNSTTIRAGAGVFYDLGYTFSGSALSAAFYPYGSNLQVPNVPLNTDAITTLPDPPSLNSPYPALFAYEPDYRLPYTIQWNLTLDQPVTEHDIVSIGYVGAAGRRLGRVEVLTAPAVNLNPEFTRINLVRNSATSDYNSLQVQYQRRLHRRLQALLSYTWSKSLDIVSDESVVNYQAPLDRYSAGLDRGPSSYDVRHGFSAALSYGIAPAGGSITRAVLGDWSIDTMIRASSATPVNVLTGDSLGFGTTSVGRPNLVPGVPLYLAGVYCGRWEQGDKALCCEEVTCSSRYYPRWVICN